MLDAPTADGSVAAPGFDPGRLVARLAWHECAEAQTRRELALTHLAGCGALLAAEAAGSPC